MSGRTRNSSRKASVISRRARWAQQGGHLGHEVALAPRCHAGHDVRGDLRYVHLEGLQEPRRQGSGDDPPEPGVPRIVEVDHGPEEFVELRRHVGDVGALAARLPGATRPQNMATGTGLGLQTLGPHADGLLCAPA
jgi:hypothetical protein